MILHRIKIHLNSTLDIFMVLFDTTYEGDQMRFMWMPTGVNSGFLVVTGILINLNVGLPSHK